MGKRRSSCSARSVPTAREAVELLVTIFESEPSMPTPGRGSCRFEVMKTLGQIGPAAVPALLDMVGRYTEDPQGFSMWTCITYYRPETLRPVFEQLSSDQVHRRRAAAGIVAVFVRDKQRLPADKELAAALAPLLEDADEQVRRHALNALLKIPQEAAAAIPLLVSWLQGEDTRERFAAAEALAKIGPAALPALRGAAGSQNAEVRRAAVYGIGEMKPVPQSEVPLLLALAADKVPGVQGFALASLGRAGDACPEVVEFLIEALDDPVIRYGAAEALGELGPGASVALSKLTAQLPTVGPEERLRLAKSIWQIDAASPAVFPALIEVLRDTNTVRAGQALRNREVDGKIVVAWGPFTEPVSCCAAEVLREMGPAAAPAVQALIEVANSSNSRRGAIGRRGFARDRSSRSRSGSGTERTGPFRGFLSRAGRTRSRVGHRGKVPSDRHRDDHGPRRDGQCDSRLVLPSMAARMTRMKLWFDPKR